ncbi:MAG TPA: LuxR C-terminal-related transcriptional regulator [Aldersonia sp.]
MSRREAQKAFAALVTLDGELRDDLRLIDRSRAAASLCDAIAASEVTTTAAIAAASSGSPLADATRTRLIVACLDAQSKAREAVASDLEHRVAAIPAAVARIRDARSIDELVRRTCAELTGALGFRCATYSEVDAAAGAVRFRHSRRDLSRAGSPAAWQISAAESQCIAERRPIIVHAAASTSDDAAACRTEAASIVVAPIITKSAATALIHADREPPWSVDAADVRLLEIVTAAFTAIHERETDAERLELQQQAMVAAARRLVDHAESTVAQDVLGITDTWPAQRVPQNSTPRAAQGLLTRRESEVLQLIARGLSNAEIAEELVVGVETVKSHVKKVLRKLGAANRAEAIAVYLESTRPPTR